MPKEINKNIYVKGRKERNCNDNLHNQKPIIMVFTCYYWRLRNKKR